MRKYGYVQQIIEDFQKSDRMIMIVAISNGTYSNPNSARCSYRSAIKKLGYNIVSRILNGDMYLIKVQNPNWTMKNYDRVCHSCINRWPSKECAVCDNMSSYTPKEGADNHE